MDVRTIWIRRQIFLESSIYQKQYLQLKSGNLRQQMFLHFSILQDPRGYQIKIWVYESSLFFVFCIFFNVGSYGVCKRKVLRRIFLVDCPSTKTLRSALRRFFGGFPGHRQYFNVSKNII